MVVPVFGLVTRHMEQMLVPDGSNQESKQSTAAELEKLTVLMSEMKAAAGEDSGQSGTGCAPPDPFLYEVTRRQCRSFV